MFKLIEYLHIAIGYAFLSWYMINKKKKQIIISI